MRKSIILPLIVFACLFSAKSPLADASPGDRDTSFNSPAGVVFQNNEEHSLGLSYSGFDVVMQPDGKIIVAGARVLIRYSSNGTIDTTFGIKGIVNYTGWIKLTTDGKIIVADTKLLRLTTDGKLDRSFGVNGFAKNDAGNMTLALALQPDGKIIVLSRSKVWSNSFLQLTRYTHDGMPDATFGTHGTVIQRTESMNYANGMAVQPDGKIVIVGDTGHGSGYITRFNSDGTLDTAFGRNGTVTTEGVVSSFRTVALQPDEKIVVAATPKDPQIRVLIFRYDKNGELDLSFGNAGIVSKVEANPGVFFFTTSIAVQADGKIAVCGTGGVLRYTSDGTPDSTFGENGAVFASWGYFNDLAIQPDGKLVVVGNRQPTELLVRRYMSDGMPDGTFGLGGDALYVRTSADDRGDAVAVQLDGKILVAANSSSTLWLTRYNDDGSLDGSFGQNGRVSSAVRAGTSNFLLALQSDEKIVVVGTAQSESLFVLRYDKDGKPDSSFDVDGVASHEGVAEAVAIQADGKIVIGGHTSGNSQVGLMLLRYNSDGTMDKTFGVDGVVTQNSYTFGRAVALKPDGKIVVASDRIAPLSFAQFHMSGEQSSQPTAALLRFHQDGSQDTSFGDNGIAVIDNLDRTNRVISLSLGTNGTILVAGHIAAGAAYVARYDKDGKHVGSTSFSGYAGGMVVQPDGKTVVVGSNLDNDLVVLRYNTDWTADDTFRTREDVKDYGSGRAVCIQPDGKIVVVGTTSNSDVMILRLIGGDAVQPLEKTYFASPNKRQILSYLPAGLPLTSVNPEQANPLGIGPVAEGGDSLYLKLAFPEFLEAVDIYLGIHAQAVSSEVFIIQPDNSLSPASQGVIPWRENTRGPFDESLYGHIPVNSLAYGTYDLYVVVTPSGSMNDFYLWHAVFDIP